MYPNSDPGMFWVAFYGCLLAEVIPVPIEVPLSRKVNIQEHFTYLSNVNSVILVHIMVQMFLCVITGRREQSGRFFVRKLWGGPRSDQ